MSVYQVFTVKGKFTTPQVNVPVSRGFNYAQSIALLFAKKERADGYQIIHPDGALTGLVL